MDGPGLRAAAAACEQAAASMTAMAAGRTKAPSGGGERDRLGGYVDAAAALLAAAVAALEASAALFDPDAPAELSSSAPPPLPSLELLGCARSAIRVLRVACALGPDLQTRVGVAGVDALLGFLRFDARSGEGGENWNATLDATRRLAWQALANAVAGGHHTGNVAALWSRLMMAPPAAGGGAADASSHGSGARLVLPAALEAARRDPALAGVVASLLYACCREEGGDDSSEGTEVLASSQPPASTARLAQLASDTVVYPRLLSFVHSQASGAAPPSGDRQPRGPVDDGQSTPSLPAHGRPGAPAEAPGLEWHLLLTGRLAAAGLLGRAFATAGAGTPLALLAGEGVAGSGGSSGGGVSLTREQLGLLGLLEAYVDAESGHRASNDGDDGDAGAGEGGYGWHRSGADGSGEPPPPSATTPPLPARRLLLDGDLAFFARHLGALCSSAVALAASASSSPSSAGAAAGSDATDRLALAARPTLVGVCMLADVLSDVLALTGAGAPATGTVAAAGDRPAAPALGAAEAAALQALLCAEPPPSPHSEPAPAGPSEQQQPPLPPLSAALELLYCVTPPPNVGGGRAGSGADVGPAPEMVDISEEDGIPRPVEAHAPAADVPSPAEAAAAVAAADAACHLCRFPPALVPPGARSSLTRLVALAAAAAPPARQQDEGGGDNGGASVPPPPPTLPVASAVLRLAPPPGLGVFTLLNQCVLDGRNPLLREWGLLGVRALCAASPQVVEVIRGMRALRATAAPELAALGVTPRLVPKAATAAAGSGGSSGADDLTVRLERRVPAAGSADRQPAPPPQQPQ
jgi:hypothetical protein